jgi:hypothetical protein
MKSVSREKKFGILALGIMELLLLLVILPLSKDTWHVNVGAILLFALGWYVFWRIGWLKTSISAPTWDNSPILERVFSLTAVPTLTLPLIVNGWPAILAWIAIDIWTGFRIVALIKQENI